MGKLHDIIGIRKQQAIDVQSKGLPGGHWLAEQLSGEVYVELDTFFRQAQ